MRITSGTLKGRRIPFAHGKFNDAAVTPSKVKEAVFSMLGEDLTGKRFLDLFAGSGQVGLEALSRGAALTVFNDSDGKRVRFISSLLRNWGIEERSQVLHMSADRCLRLLEHREMSFDIIFLDPPYLKQGNETVPWSRVFESICGHRVLSDNGTVILQYYAKNVLPERAGELNLKKIRVYGTSALGVYGVHTTC